jgi:adenosylhomocysteine nucleosidase
MKLLFVASDRMEFPGLLRRCRQVRTVSLAVDWARSGSLGEHEVLLVANGAGAARAAAAVDAVVKTFSPDAIVSLGFCGALDPSLNIADVVVSTGSGVQVPSSAPPHRAGVVCSVDHVARTAEEKRRLHASGAVAVEMEAAGVAARAHALGVPFYCIKSVTDLAGETMANDFNAAMRPDGHFDTIGILKSSLRHPSVRLPELVRLRKRCVRAASALGDFVADCRF